MGNFLVETETIVERLSKDVKFMQPTYEAIINSLEANAKHVKVDFFCDSTFSEDVSPHITSFTITDDGDGFTQNNIEAFNQLWTKNKLKLGCKGSGRFTWLSVYKNIRIESYLKDARQKIVIPFDLSYDKNNIEIYNEDIKETKTVITFNNVTKKFYSAEYGKKVIEKRSEANLLKIQEGIVNYLLIKLFLMKQKNQEFEIVLTLNGENKIISNQTVPNLNKEKFEVVSKINNETYNFDLYYKFYTDNNNSKKAYYCSNNRAVKEIDDDALGFSTSLPNRDSFIMLICSDYLEGKDNDSRNELSELLDKKTPTFEYPLLFKDITPKMKECMHRIIMNKYPQLTEINQKEELNAIQNAPYLANYIRRDKSILKSEEALIKSAKNIFDNDKIKYKEKFVKALKDKQISEEEFLEAVNDLSEVAANELGEYILYRQNIIEALNKSIEDDKKNEAFIHNIFMPMKKDSKSYDEDKHLLSNLWLLDDKFMTYSYASSDKTVNQIKDAIYEKSEETYGKMNRPDITIFFNNANGFKDLVIIELKGPNADKNEKKKSITELADNVEIVRRFIPDVNNVWSYIITSIDKDFKSTLNNQDYQPCFSTDSDNYLYYKYFKYVKAHSYAIDLKTITSDAFARNDIFMSILKKPR